MSGHADSRPSTNLCPRPGDTSHLSGLRFAVATSLPQVIEGWSLVYRSYVAAGLIRPNPWRLHTVRHAVQDRSVVIGGEIGELTVSTISGYLDHADIGLPLDRVFPDELAALRRQKRTLMEIGLFADRREHIERSIEALLELMRNVFYFGVAVAATDAVISVRPRHAGFYTKLLGFTPIAGPKAHPLANDEPVMLLHLDGRRAMEHAQPSRGLRYFRENPIGVEAFNERFVLTDKAITGSDIERFLQDAAVTAAVG